MTITNLSKIIIANFILINYIKINSERAREVEQN